MKLNSVTARVTLWFTLTMTIIVVVVIVFMIIIGRSVVVDNAESVLIRTVEDNVGEIDYDNGVLDINEITLYRRNVYMIVFNDKKEIICGASSSPFEGDREFWNRVVRKVEIDGEPSYVYDYFVPNKNGNIWIRGITTQTNARPIAKILLIVSLVLLPNMVIFSAVGGWLIARQAFKPVRTIVSTVERINDGNDLKARIGLRKGPNEILQLAMAFDHLFGRLEASFESEKRFVSDASHELRTPTAVILAECEMSKKDIIGPSEYADSIAVIERQAKRLSALTNKLLTLARFEQGTRKVAFEVANLSELTDIVCDELADLHTGSITMHKEIENSVFANVDVALMTRLVQNLVENAYKYNKENGEVKVSLRRNGPNCVLSVSDTGIGMTREEQQHIWERFWQADSARTSKLGSGLGLSMVKQIAEAHGGTISVFSEPGKGSRFSYTMKCADNGKKATDNGVMEAEVK